MEPTVDITDITVNVGGSDLQNLHKSLCLHIQGVPGGMDKTSGECSLC